MRETFFNTQELPLIIEPDSDNSAAHLENWLKENKGSFLQKSYKHGAVLFRGFDAGVPKQFEEIALAIDANLKNDYLGTSPRDRVAGTEFVFSASELPGYYPIMQHCEMSYAKQPPVKIFFYCDVEPEYGGETPICNFRKVYRELDKNVRDEFDKKGVITVRNYTGLNGGSKFNLWELKRWDEIFLTKEKTEVEKQCREHEIEYEWLNNGNLRLLHRTPAAVKHPVTGETTWFNHSQVFHPAAAPIEYERIHSQQHRLKTLFWTGFLKVMVKMKKISTEPINQSMNVLFGDGKAIPDSYMRHIEDVIWNNIVIFPWKKNDILAIDNFSTSHGRLPYEGKRRILVCWSA